MKKLIILLCLTFFLTGCYDNIELNDLAIIDDFICNLKNINFENWQEKYVPSKGSIDPNYWEIVMKFENDKIVFEGVDCYPEDFDKVMNILFKYSNIFNNYKDE